MTFPILIGLLLFGVALYKASHLEEFGRSVAELPLITSETLPILTIGVPMVEGFLGILILITPAHRGVLVGIPTSALFLVFITFHFWRIYAGLITPCSCGIPLFGIPPEYQSHAMIIFCTIVLNLCQLWWWFKETPPSKSTTKERGTQKGLYEGAV